MQAFVNGYGLTVRRKNGKTLLAVDFGHLAFGVAKISLDMPDGTPEILCEYGPDKDFFPAKTILHAVPQADGSILLENEMPLAMRFLRLTTAEKLRAGQVLSIGFESFEHPGVAKSSFFCDDALMNRIWEAGAKTIHLCRVQNKYSYAFRRPEMDKPVRLSEAWRGEGESFVLVDGPRRDKEVWVGDLLPEIRTCLTVFGDGETVRNSLLIFADMQREDGFIPASSVSSQDFLEYCCWYCVCVYEYYRMTADRTFVGKLLPSVEKTVKFFSNRRDKNGLLSLGKMQTWAWTLQRDGKITSSNCVQVMALMAAAELFAIWGKKSEALQAEKMAAQTAESLNAMAYDSRCRAFRDVAENESAAFSLDAGALAVLSRVAGGETARGALQYILRRHKGKFGFYNIFPKENKTADNYSHNMEIWPFANNFLLDALFEQNFDREAFDLIKDCWGTMATQSETFWEIIDHKTGKFMNRALFENGLDMDRFNSECHGWSAGINYTFMRYLAGICLESPGYERFVFQPHPCGIKKLAAELSTPGGIIKVSYKKSGETRYSAVLQLPEGVTCVYNQKQYGCGTHSVNFRG